MTLRDLSPQKIRALQTHARREQQKFVKRTSQAGNGFNFNEMWKAAFNSGLKAGLAINEFPS